jgi:hypothetical protein
MAQAADRLTPFFNNRVFTQNITLVREFGDGVGDCVVKATVERSKFVGRWRARTVRDWRDCSAARS